jgi:hypothetical protein
VTDNYGQKKKSLFEALDNSLLQQIVNPKDEMFHDLNIAADDK